MLLFVVMVVALLVLSVVLGVCMCVCVFCVYDVEAILMPTLRLLAALTPVGVCGTRKKESSCNFWKDQYTATRLRVPCLLSPSCGVVPSE